MEIEDFIEQWIEGQARKFAAEVEEYDQLMTVLTDLGENEDDV